MRNLVGGFGLTCGLIVIGLVGRYGYRSTDVEVDAWIVAFLFGAIAAGGLFGHAVAVRLWEHSKPAAIGVGAVSAMALLLNLSNSLGAIAGRAETATMDRIAKNRAIRASETELKRLMALRDAAPFFKPTDAAALAAAQRSADAATKARAAECEKRGLRCRDREAGERTANAELALVAEAKAATDRANQLEADADRERRELAALGPAVTVNVQGSAITKLFRLPDGEADFAATAQQFGIAAVVELLIMMALIAWEVMRRADAPEFSIEPIQPAMETNSSVTPKAPQPMKLKRKCTEPPTGQVMRIMTEVLEPAPGKSVCLESGYRRYATICQTKGLEPVEPNTYLDAMVEFCRTVGLTTKAKKGRLHLVNVQLAEGDHSA